MQAFQDQAWPRIAVVGAGAVGCYFGGMMARAGAPVNFIGRPEHVDAMRRDGLFFETATVQEHVPVRASTEIASAHDAQMILFCVKSGDTERVARELVPHLAPGSAVVSLQNGVDNARRIQFATGIDVIPAVVYVACSMAGPGHVRHAGFGNLVIGKSTQIAQVFERAGVPCRVSDLIETELWKKLLLNCAYNAISALARAKYGEIVRNEGAREVMRRMIEEAVEVAHADGIELPGPALIENAFRAGEVMAQAISSTAQDISRGKTTEIDSLNGYVVRRGVELGVATPVNQAMYALVKLLEAGLNSRAA